jgi:hypothetical protein
MTIAMRLQEKIHLYRFENPAFCFGQCHFQPHLYL